MVTRFIIVRHGETTWNKEGRYQGQQDTPLSERGREQGGRAARALKDIPIHAVYASPLRRSYETAEMCARYHHLPVQQEPRLLEINHGAWEGRLAREVEEQYPELLRQWHTTVTDVRMPGGETLAEVQQRAMAAIYDIAVRHDGQTVLIAGHDAVNKAVLCRCLDMPLDHFWFIKQDNTCINVLEYQDGRFRIVLLNSTCHLGFLFSGIEQQGL